MYNDCVPYYGVLSIRNMKMKRGFVNSDVELVQVVVSNELANSRPAVTIQQTGYTGGFMGITVYLDELDEILEMVEELAKAKKDTR